MSTTEEAKIHLATMSREKSISVGLLKLLSMKLLKLTYSHISFQSDAEMSLPVQRQMNPGKIFPPMGLLRIRIMLYLYFISIRTWSMIGSQ